jgi:hypothetical protein
MIFWKLKKYTTQWTLFALLPLGRYGNVLGQNHKLLLKSHWKWGKLYTYFIIISIKIQKNFFIINITQVIITDVSKTVCILYWPFLAKMGRFSAKVRETIEYGVLWNSCMHTLSECNHVNAQTSMHVICFKSHR